MAMTMVVNPEHHTNWLLAALEPEDFALLEPHLEFVSLSRGQVLLLHHLKHNRVLHERVFLVSVVVLDAPKVANEDRVHLVPIGAGIERLVLRLGFTEEPHVPAGLRLAMAQHQIPDFDPENVTYYVGRQTVVATEARTGMAFWREIIFAMLNRNAELTADYFCIPARQVVEIGSSVEI